MVAVCAEILRRPPRSPRSLAGSGEAKLATASRNGGRRQQHVVTTACSLQEGVLHLPTSTTSSLEHFVGLVRAGPPRSTSGRSVSKYNVLDGRVTRCGAKLHRKWNRRRFSTSPSSSSSFVRCLGWQPLLHIAALLHFSTFLLTLPSCAALLINQKQDSKQG